QTLHCKVFLMALNHSCSVPFHGVSRHRIRSFTFAFLSHSTSMNFSAPKGTECDRFRRPPEPLRAATYSRPAKSLFPNLQNHSDAPVFTGIRPCYPFGFAKVIN